MRVAFDDLDVESQCAWAAVQRYNAADQVHCHEGGDICGGSGPDLLRHLHRRRCLPSTGHLKQRAEKRSCESERATFWSQSTQEERLEMIMKWSTQCSFFYVAYDLAQIALYQFVILGRCRVSPRHKSRSAPWSCLSDV